MRILRFLVIAVVLIAVAVGGSFVIAREALLTWSVWGVKDTLVSFRSVSGNPQQFMPQCAQYRINKAGPAQISSLELTFINDREYQFQVICEDYPYEPVVMKQYQLGPLVTKAPGSAGFVWSETTPTAITLQLWGRTQSVTLTPTKTTVTQGPVTAPLALSPQAVCSAYGFQCCAEDSTQGSGTAATTAIDCPKTCFSQCLVRPVILSLNTQPFYDPKTRSLTVRSGQEVTFSYTTNLTAQTLQSLVLEFGDTQKYQTASPSGSVNHKYYCINDRCQYQAKLVVTDTQNLTNVTNAVNQVKVVVQP